MPIDPSIALSYKPVQIQDPMEMYGKRQQIQTNALAMQKYQTESAEKNALAQLISQPGYDPYNPEAQAAAFKVAPTLAPAMFKNLQETRTAGVAYETQNQALADARYKAGQIKVADATKEIIRHDTPESVLEDLKQRVAKGDLTQDQANAISSSLPKTAADMSKWQISMLRRSLTAAEQLEQNVQTTDLGGQVQTTVRPKFAGGAAPQVTTASKTATPGDLLTSATAARRLAYEQGRDVVEDRFKERQITAQETEANAKKKPAANDPAIAAFQDQKYNSIKATISEAKALVGPGESGFLGPIASKIGGTKARTLAGKINTIKANLGFEQLQRMREASPTGGALGQVAVKELERLESTVASLDLGLPTSELLNSLKKVEEHYDAWNAAVQKSRVASNLPRLTPEQAQKLPSGTKFVGTDGVERTTR